MSYCRFSDSDIYLFSHIDNYICCCCCKLRPQTQKTIFTKGVKPGDHFLFSEGIEGCKECEGEGCSSCCTHPNADFQNYQDAIQHVKEHIAAGHYVNSNVIPRLERDYRMEKWSPASRKLKNRHRRTLMLLRSSDLRLDNVPLPTFYMSNSQHHVGPWVKSTHYCGYPYPRLLSVEMPVRKTIKSLARKFRALKKKRSGGKND